jgi:leucine-rich repeat protein SHOC2
VTEEELEEIIEKARIDRAYRLDLTGKRLTTLPDSIGSLNCELKTLNIEGNPFNDLEILNSLTNLQHVWFLDANLPRQYWTKFDKWKPEWLLYEDNIEIKRLLIKQVGYEKICTQLNAVELDNWREYTLLRINVIERYYSSEEPMVLLKMTCPSTGHIHILRVPPEMNSAEAAITWVNHGIHPDEFSVQT